VTVLDAAGHTIISEEYLAVSVDENVLGLNVTVHQSLRVEVA